MQYPLTQQLDTRQNVLIDAYDAAHLVQSLLEPILMPPAQGVYLPDQLDPVLRAGCSYWYEKPEFVESVVEGVATINKDIQQFGGYGQTPVIYGDQPMVKLHTTPWQYYHYVYIPVTNFSEVSLSPWDIVDVNPNLDVRPKRVVLPHHLAPRVVMQPTLPVNGLKIVKAVLANEIDISRAFSTDRRGQLLEEIIFPMTRPEFQNLEHMQRDRWIQDSLALVYDGLMPMISAVRVFTRDNPYQMCSIYHHDGYQLRVEQLGDYRIMAWEQITADPEYQRWLRARANGDWDRYVSQQEEIIANNSAYIATSNPYR